MPDTTRRKHVRYERLDRLRKTGSNYLGFLALQATRLSVPARVVRDLISHLGGKQPYEIAAAADAEAAGVVLSTAATLDIERAEADDGDAPFLVGAALEEGASVSLGLNLPAMRLGAQSAALTVAFVDGGGSDDTITRASGSFLTDGFRPGCTVAITNPDEPGNAGPFVLEGVSALTLTLPTGSVTADASDSVTITSLDVVTGAGIDDAIEGATLTVGGGANAGAYEIGDVGADYALLADPLVAFDATEACSILDQITRADGSFLDDGFRPGGFMLISGSADNDAATPGIAEVAEGYILLETLVLEAPEAAQTDLSLYVADQIYRDAGSFIDDGFAEGQRIYVDGVFVGLASSSVSADRLEIQAQMPVELRGTTTESIVSDVSLIRASGDFEDDGFAVGDKVAITVGGEAFGGLYYLAVVNDLGLAFADPQPDLGSETGAELVLYKLSARAREDTQPDVP